MTAKTEGGIDLAAIKALFQESLEEQMKPLRETVEALQAKVTEQDRQIPKFVPMARRDNPSGMPKNPMERLANMQPGEERSGSRGDILTTQNGRRMDSGAMAALFQSYQPIFKAGQEVRINPDAHRLGWAEGRTWAALLKEEPRNPEGWGTIVEIAPFSHRGWMYMVKATGHTPALGMVFDEHELVSA